MQKHAHTFTCPFSHARRIARAATCLLLAAAGHAAYGQCITGFAAPVTAISATSPKAPIILDVDQDGLGDVIALSGTSVYFARGQAGGTFASPMLSSAGGTPVAMVAGDFIPDGIIDLATMNQSGAAISVLRGNGNGSFLTLATYSTPCGNPTAITAGDFNGDGITDLAVSCVTGSISIFIGAGNGSFSAGSTFATGNVSPLALTSGDFDSDGRLDLVASFSATPQILLMRGAGDGTFPTLNPSTIPGVSPNSLAVGDLNSDGRPDLVFAASGVLMGMLTNVSGNFGTTYSIATGAAIASGIALVDLDGNGRLDIVCTGGTNNNVSYLMGTAGTAFIAPVSISLTGNPVATAIGDLNGDGRPDLAVTCTTGNQVRAFTSLFDGSVSITSQPVTTSALDGAAASFTVGALGSGQIYQWRRNGVNLTNTAPYSGANSATLTINPVSLAGNLDIFDVVVSNPCNAVTSRPAALAVTSCPGDFNQDGNIDFFDYLDFVDAFSIGC